MYDSAVNHHGHILLIPFHFPPIQGSTGASRSWEFAKWLPDFGWRVSVLTAHTRAYAEVSDELGEWQAIEGRVVRAFALDAKRHLSIFGRYARFTAFPDRWSTWIVGGVLSGIRQIRRDRPDVIYSTYPIVSSHLIGLTLHKLFGIPWMAEFRDPMVEENFPSPGLERRLRLWLERRALESARRIISVTPSAQKFYEERAGRGPGFAVEIANGVNDTLLQMPPDDSDSGSTTKTGKVTLLHSGILYDGVRDPRSLLLAIRDLKAQGALKPADVEFVFRGGGDEADFKQQAFLLGIDDLVQFRESVPYQQAFREMRNADALMVLQGRRCNRQIPAKLYEYCAMKKPMLCLADPEGDTGRLFAHLELGRSVMLEDVEAISSHLPQFISDLRNGRGRILDTPAIEALSRRARAKELAALLDEVKREGRAI